MNRRRFLKHLGLAAAGACLPQVLGCQQSQAANHVNKKPNFLIVFTDDQGYGDLGCYGSTTIRTPRLDHLAAEGTRFTNFYAQPVCGPSRSALLTGRYPVRSGGWSMPESEVTIAECLKTAGYTTGCIGKWDVSNRADIKGRIPNDQGFDYYWGALEANDNAKLTLYNNRDHVSSDRDTHMDTITERYTDKAIGFLKANKDKPFLLYLAHSMPHSVIDASEKFKGKSKAGLYGDVIEEIDYNTGRLLDAIDELGLRDNTIVIFTTDNGPWCNFQENLRKRHNGAIAWGSAEPLRDGKGSTWEGGLRVPCIVRWPGNTPAGQDSSAIFATIDFLPTFAHLAGCEIPQDRIIDGVDQTKLLQGKSKQGARDDYYYFCRNELQAVRKGQWKLILPDRKKHYGYVKDLGTNEIELYDLASDIGETKNLADQHPDIVADLMQLAKSFKWPETLPPTYIRIPQK